MVLQQVAGDAQFHDDLGSGAAVDKELAADRVDLRPARNRRVARGEQAEQTTASLRNGRFMDAHLQAEPALI
jgi:hypothetical protein